jgi:hypothetical protein
MNYENLHTSALEKLFGPIGLRIISEDDKFRITELYDPEGISRTLGIVKFGNIESPALKPVHNKILKGGLLGKTLFESNIEFDKEFIGSCIIKLPDWLKDDFKTPSENGLGIFSRIFLYPGAGANDKILYAEVIEIIPSDLMPKFEDKNRPLMKIDKNLRSLLKVANLEAVKLENEL